MPLFISTIKYVSTDILLNILALPVWWYSQGLIQASRRFIRHLKFTLQFTGLKIWVLNLFKPMFGDISWQGRLISFALRFIFLIFKIILFFIFLILALILFFFYLGLPPLVIYMIIQQLT